MSFKRGRNGVLFDVDGTLVDTAYLHALCWSQAFRQHGRNVPMPALGWAIGMGSGVLIEHVSRSDAGRRGGNLRRARCAVPELLESAAALPGARELIAARAERGLVVVLA